MNHLLRELAPVSEAAWAQIDSEARSRLVPALAARRLVDFSGPRGWDHSALNLGHAMTIDAPPVNGVEAQLREVLPLVELRAPFTLTLQALENADRGSRAIDLAGLDHAARQMALAENIAVLHGYPMASIRGISELSSHEPIAVSDDWTAYPSSVATATERMRMVGVDGPYGLALGNESWLGVAETIEGGYPLMKHLRDILGGPIVWAPGIEGGIVISQRGGDFSLECGQDISVGYSGHDQTEVSLYLEQSFTFWVLEPDAAVALHL
ncbi:MAG: family 1 encapsulin nanocompartment shell protein [Acidimicrobiales bacterium]